MRNLILMVLVVILIIVDIVVLIELFNYGRSPLTTILFLVASIAVITAIIKSRKKPARET